MIEAVRGDPPEVVEHVRLFDEPAVHRRVDPLGTTEAFDGLVELAALDIDERRI